MCLRFATTGEMGKRWRVPWSWDWAALIGVPESFRGRLLIAFSLAKRSKVDDEAYGSVGSRQKWDGSNLVLEERDREGLGA